MFRGPILLAFLAAGPAFGADVRLLSSLPQGAVSSAIKLDAAGNIYLAGYFAPGGFVDTQDAFVAKLSADGSKILYFTPMAGTSLDAATTLVVASDGSVYVAGSTASSDFPVTAGAFEPNYSGIGPNQGFLAKLNPAGVVVYSTFLNGTTFTQITGIALGSGGEVFLTGLGGPGYSLSGAQSIQGFVIKLDAAMSKVLLSVYGYGGGLIQVDSQGNLYLAGSAEANVTFGSSETLSLPPFPAGAFQTTHAARFCLTTGGGVAPGGSYSCRYQYVAKLDPTGAILWGSYVTGTYGAIARGMAIDSGGNVIVAGTTYSDDYPVTSGVFQTAYVAGAPPFPVPAGSPYQAPPASSGYITKINSTGTALAWSTYFGGSFFDEITGMAVGPTGDVYVSGRSGSHDLPGLAGTADGCRPSSTQVLGFVARVASDGGTAGPVQLVTGAPECSYLTCPINTPFPSYSAAWPLALRSDGTVLTAGTNGTVASVDFSASSRLSCMTDAADNVQLSSVTPGQLVALFGPELAPGAPFVPSSGVAASTTNFGVYFNGVAAPILYSSGQQMNVQVPFEIAGQTTVQMKVVDNQIPFPLAETRTVAVTDRQPAIYLSHRAWESPFPWYTECGGMVVLGEAALALNANGTLNDCTNPAPGGSVVTLFVGGLGQVTPAFATGVIVQTPAVAVTAGVTVLDPNLAPLNSTTSTSPGMITGVEKVQFQVPATSGSLTPFDISPKLIGTPLRERLVLIWVR